MTRRSLVPQRVVTEQQDSSVSSGEQASAVSRIGQGGGYHIEHLTKQERWQQESKRWEHIRADLITKVHEYLEQKLILEGQFRDQRSSASKQKTITHDLMWLEIHVEETGNLVHLTDKR